MAEDLEPFSNQDWQVKADEYQPRTPSLNNDAGGCLLILFAASMLMLTYVAVMVLVKRQRFEGDNDLYWLTVLGIAGLAFVIFLLIPTAIRFAVRHCVFRAILSMVAFSLCLALVIVPAITIYYALHLHHWRHVTYLCGFLFLVGLTLGLGRVSLRGFFLARLPSAKVPRLPVEIVFLPLLLSVGALLLPFTLGYLAALCARFAFANSESLEFIGGLFGQKKPKKRSFPVRRPED